MLLTTRLFVVLLAIVFMVGCEPTAATHWAGQSVFKDWQTYIDGTAIESGYRSPLGTFEVKFPICANHVWIDDFVDKGYKQNWGVHVVEFVMFKDLYGYDSKIITMNRKDLPALADLSYPWVIKNMPDIYDNEPTTDTLEQDQRFGTWRKFTFGPSMMTNHNFGYRIEAFLVRGEAIYRVITYNHEISEVVREYVKMPDDRAREMAVESAVRNFNVIMDSLVLKGLKPAPYQAYR